MDLSDWFNEMPNWLGEAAKRLNAAPLEEFDIKELANSCKNEVLGQIEGDSIIPKVFTQKESSKSLKLCSIGNICGVNALSPRNPLNFGDGNLAVIFGQNGSGKSGYVRIIKHICGARNTGPIHPNIYKDEEIEQKCSIGFSENRQAVQTRDYCFTEGPLPELFYIDVFDTNCGKSYIEKENEVTYEPPVLTFFSGLIDACEKVAAKLDEEINSYISVKPIIPAEYLNTTPGKWYQQISKSTPEEEICLNCSWSEEEKVLIEEIQKRLSENAPAEAAVKVRNEHQHLKTLSTKTGELFSDYSDVVCNEISLLKRKQNLAKKTEVAAAEVVFNNANLSGIGSEVWGNLWECARKFSSELAYTGIDFPNVQDGSVCVLCHQVLSEDAKRRLESFENFVKGEAKKNTLIAESELRKKLDSLPAILDSEALRIKLDASGISDEEEKKVVFDFYNSLRNRKEILTSEELFENLEPLPSLENWKSSIDNKLEKLLEKAREYENDAKTGNRNDLIKKNMELQAKKWLSQQLEAIRKEKARLKKVAVLKEAKALTNTRPLSAKKGELAESLITEAFCSRFDSELRKLSGESLKVKLTKARVSKGRVLHSIKHNGDQSVSLPEVLSEGEHRIVALAGFLADVTGRKNTAPFVFDDPISSLDQDFEERVVQRLVELSDKRQVIVFTHRLSLLNLLQDSAKKMCVAHDVISIRKEYWGTGEPGELSLFASRPDKALNALRNERLSRAKKHLQEEGSSAYEIHAKALCSEFRILLERMIELELMGAVIQRFRRDVTTKGKIENLAKISLEDCKLFDELMTKYSIFEHSQPQEAPVALPRPDEFDADFTKLQTWLVEFKKREITA